MAFRGGRRRRGNASPTEERETPNTPIHWRKLLTYLSPHKGRLAIAIVALLVYSAIGLVFPLTIGRLLDSVLEQQSQSQLNLLTGSLLLLFLVMSAFGFVQSYTLTYIGESIVLDLRTALYRQLQRMSLDFYAKRRVGELISRISSDVTQVRTVLTTNLTQLIGQTISLIGALAIVFYLNPYLMIFILVLVPILLVVGIFFGRLVERVSTTVQDALAESTVTVEESLQGIRVVKSFAREEYEIGRYNGAMQKTFAASIKLAIYRGLFGATGGFLGFGALAAFLWFSGREVLAGRLSVGMIASFLVYGVTIAASLGTLSSLYSQFREAMGAIRRVFEILDSQPSVNDAPDAKQLPPIAGSIRLNNISFRYADKSPVIKNVSLEIAPGEIVALVGPSGAGKSTLFNLIPRFYDPSEGSISIDGHDLRSVTQESLRAQIGMVHRLAGNFIIAREASRIIESGEVMPMSLAKMGERFADSRMFAEMCANARPTASCMRETNVKATVNRGRFNPNLGLKVQDERERRRKQTQHQPRKPQARERKKHTPGPTGEKALAQIRKQLGTPSSPEKNPSEWAGPEIITL